MSRFFNRIALAVGMSASLLTSLPSKTRAQTYPIDCAILLCLSGGWPKSAPCHQARAEFIRRITPWPVEPPLQIWRCPMGASFDTNGIPEFGVRIQNINLGILPALPGQMAGGQKQAVLEYLRPADNVYGYHREATPDRLGLHFVQLQADIDISGPEFNFVRSIRVFHVRNARQYRSNREDECRRSASVELGTYGMQGEFSWTPSSVFALPDAHIGLEGWGQSCPNVSHRSVFVDWRDFEGHYGFEQVNY